MDAPAGAARTVVIVGISSPVGSATRARLVSTGHRIVGCNLTRSSGGRSALINQVLEETGRVIDGLVVCADPPLGEPVDVVVAEHHYGTIEVLDALRPALAAGRAPAAVILISNTIGIVPMPDGRLIEALADEGEAQAQRYAAATDPAEVRAMVGVALARAVRMRVVEWGRAGVRLNAVAVGSMLPPAGAVMPAHPGDSRSGSPLQPMIEALPVPLARPVEPVEVARVIEFLVDPASSAVHGTVVFADGGTDALVRPDDV